MRIKRYEAPSIQEALMKVKKDLGPEAVILYTKTFRKGGVLGFFGKPVAEITAGIELNLMDDMAKRKVSSAPVPPILERNEIPLSHAFLHPQEDPWEPLTQPGPRSRLSNVNLMK